MKAFFDFLKKLIGFLIIIGLAGVSIWWYLTQNNDDNPTIPTRPTTSQTTGPNNPNRPTQPTNSEVPGPPNHAQLAQVEYVHDGDTLFLTALEKGEHITKSGEVKVRLIGTDSPEVSEPKECYADQATDYLRDLARKGDHILVATDKEPEDHYGRSLLYLWTLDGDFINYIMVADGYAEAIRVRPNDSHWDLLRDAERNADLDKLGMWGACY